MEEEQFEMNEEQMTEYVKTTYSAYKNFFDTFYGTSNKSNQLPEPTPFGSWRLEEIIKYCIKFDYKQTSLIDLEEAFYELYQRQKSKEGFYLIDKIRITSNNIHHSNDCLGVFFPKSKFLKDEKATIFISDNKFISRKGNAFITGNRQNYGIQYLSTYFHEAQHEQQFSNLARLFQKGRLSNQNVISAIMTMFYGVEQDYYRRYIEFDAELVSIKKMYSLYKNGLITDDNDIVLLYEKTDKFLQNFNISKVRKSIRMNAPGFIDTFAIADERCLRGILISDLDAFYVKTLERYQDVIDIKAEYEKYFTNTLSDEFKEKMTKQFEHLANYKENQFEYQGKFLEKMAIAPRTIDHKRTEMFLMCYNRVVRSDNSQLQQKTHELDVNSK